MSTCGAIKFGTACGQPDYSKIYRCNLPENHDGPWHQQVYPSGGAECWPTANWPYGIKEQQKVVA
jgi:hypothetical protein